MFASSAFGAFLSFWIMLHLTYKYGTLQTGYWATPPVKSWIINPVPPDGADMASIGFAFVFVLFLSFMRSRFLWWPLHPVAYPLTLAEYGMRRMWFAFLVSWIFKRAVLKYGGIRSYRRAIPIFSGLLLGEFIVGGLLTIINFVFNIPVYPFWPG